MSRAPRERLAELCTSLPGVAVSGELHLGFEVRGRRFAWLLDDHHGDGRLALNCKAAPGESMRLAEADPGRYFVPSYLGARGWLGVYLDTEEVDWAEVERRLVEAYRMIAPKRLAAQLDAF